jgi:hypothetical protein
MDCAHSKNGRDSRSYFSRQSKIVAGLSVALTWLLTTVSMGYADENSFDEVSFPAPNGYYMLKDRDMPRKGKIIVSENAAGSQFNFEFCDGERTSVDLKTLLVADADCEGEPTGTFSASAEEFIGAPVYNSELGILGEVTAINSFKKGEPTQLRVVRGGYLGTEETSENFELDPSTASIQRSDTGEYSIILRDRVSKDIEERSYD